MTDQKDHLTSCLSAITTENGAQNIVAWADLHKAGLTRELLSEVSQRDTWLGPKPRFQDAPPYDNVMWKFLMDMED